MQFRYIFLALAVACTPSPSPTANSQNPTKIVMAASTQPLTPASWTVPNWYIDPANTTGCAADTNTCTSATCAGAGTGPCATYAEIVVHRWGTTAPTLAQNTTVSFLSSHSDNSDPVILAPILKNAAIFYTAAERTQSTFRVPGVCRMQAALTSQISLHPAS